MTEAIVGYFGAASVIILAAIFTGQHHTDWTLGHYVDELAGQGKRLTYAEKRRIYILSSRTTRRF